MVITFPCARALALPSKPVVRALTNEVGPWGPEFSLLKEVQLCHRLLP